MFADLTDIFAELTDNLPELTDNTPSLTDNFVNLTDIPATSPAQNTIYIQGLSRNQAEARYRGWKNLLS